MTNQVWLFTAMMVFVVVAVPFKIRQRRNRMAVRMAGKPSA